MTVSDEPSAVRWRFFPWWMLAFLGFPLGGLLALVLVGSVDGVASGAVAGAWAGAVIGAAQWLVLRRYLRVGVGWVLATALGVAIGDAVGAFAHLSDLATGVAVGLSQWALLRGGFNTVRRIGVVDLEGTTDGTPTMLSEPLTSGPYQRLWGAWSPRPRLRTLVSSYSGRMASVPRPLFPERPFWDPSQP